MLIEKSLTWFFHITVSAGHFSATANN